MAFGQNSYWLNFFLKRDVNVVVWNYRRYGRSSTTIWDFFHNPDKAKNDAEQVLAKSI